MISRMNFTLGISLLLFGFMVFVFDDIVSIQNHVWQSHSVGDALGVYASSLGLSSGALLKDDDMLQRILALPASFTAFAVGMLFLCAPSADDYS